MSNVTVKNTDGKLEVASPYHPSFPGKAKMLGGRWNPSNKTWVFDARIEEAVRHLCIETFGTDGDEAETVTLKVTFKKLAYRGECSYYIAGRQIARVFGRDSGAKLGDGVILLEGKMTSSGSRKNPALEISEGTMIQIFDVPKAAVEKALADEKITVEIIG